MGSERLRNPPAVFLLAAALALPAAAQAVVGVTEIASKDGDPVTVFYPCAACVRLLDFPNGGHGALLSPFPPGLSGTLAELLDDPPGFDRSALPDANRRIAAFFRKHLLP